MRLHLANVHPNERGILCGTPTKQPRPDTYLFIVCCLFKPVCAERVKVSERETKRERVRASERARARSVVLAISSFTCFCEGNMLPNMFKLK